MTHEEPIRAADKVADQPGGGYDWPDFPAFAEPIWGLYALGGLLVVGAVAVLVAALVGGKI